MSRALMLLMERLVMRETGLFRGAKSASVAAYLFLFAAGDIVRQPNVVLGNAL